MEGQYLTKKVLTENIPHIFVKSEELGSADTYNETKILDTFKKLPKDAQILIYKAALQLAVIGFGNKNYGFIRLNDKETIKLEDIFKKYNVKYLEKINMKYNDEELSARRLLRLFRFQIQDFIRENKRPSYLYLKYSNKDEKYIDICYPGGEHVVETKNGAEYLIQTYNNLDITKGTKFVQRLQRVFIARGILSPEYFINK